MIYELRHKDIVVLDLEIDDDTGVILKVPQAHTPSHIPMGVRFQQGVIDKKALNHWLSGRNIPASRQNINHALDVIGEPSTQRLIAKCYGLSLSDCYWICPKGLDLTFGDINFFQNSFSQDMGELLFGAELDEFSLVSPDNTSDGWLQKRWIIRNNQRYLVKGSSGIYNQEPFNEKIASLLCAEMEIPHVPYEVELMDGKPYSLCPNFLSQDKELVSAWSVCSQFKKSNEVSPYEHLLQCYEKLGVKNPRAHMEQMLVLDYLLANTDRHMNNFGLLRDSNTLEILGIAPIFDSGTALFQNQSSTQFIPEIESKPFAKTHNKQITLVGHVAQYLTPTLADFTTHIDDVLTQNPFMEAERRAFICQQFQQQLGHLQSLSQARTPIQGQQMMY